MQTIQQSYGQVYLSQTQKKSLAIRFFDWCKGQEHNRFGWLAVIVFTHGCVLAPISLLAVFLNGVNMISFSFVIGAMAMSLISNLSAMPTKITIPIFFFSILIDLTVIIISVASFIQGHAW